MIRLICYRLVDEKGRSLPLYKTLSVALRFSSKTAAWQHIDTCEYGHEFLK